MIKGSFKIWEFVVLFSTIPIFILGLVLSNFAGIGSPEITIFTCFAVFTATLFVRPVWLLVNRKRIDGWEHTKATVKNKSFVKIHSEDDNYVAKLTNKLLGIIIPRYRSEDASYAIKLTLTFKDKMNKSYLETFTAPAFMRRVKDGVEFGIVFDPERPDRLIVLETARRQAKTMAILGAVLEIAMIILWIIAAFMDKSGVT